jgi:hypothetical protein
MQPGLRRHYCQGHHLQRFWDEAKGRAIARDGRLPESAESPKYKAAWVGNRFLAFRANSETDITDEGIASASLPNEWNHLFLWEEGFGTADACMPRYNEKVVER